VCTNISLPEAAAGIAATGIAAAAEA